MRIKEIKYQRVKNLGNYETERAEFVAELNEDEDPMIQIQLLRDQVEEFLFGEDEIETKTEIDFNDLDGDY
jgi:hypothetical protein